MCMNFSNKNHKIILNSSWLKKASIAKSNGIYEVKIDANYYKNNGLPGFKISDKIIERVDSIRIDNPLEKTINIVGLSTLTLVKIHGLKTYKGIGAKFYLDSGVRESDYPGQSQDIHTPLNSVHKLSPPIVNYKKAYQKLTILFNIQELPLRQEYYLIFPNSLKVTLGEDDCFSHQAVEYEDLEKNYTFRGTGSLMIAWFEEKKGKNGKTLYAQNADILGVITKVE